MVVDQHLRVEGRPTESVANNPFFFVQHRLASLYSEFRAGCWLWSVVVLLRKLLMLVACAALHDRPELARRVVVTILIISMAMHGIVRPYAAKRNEQSRLRWVGFMYGSLIFALRSLNCCRCRRVVV